MELPAEAVQQIAQTRETIYRIVRDTKSPVIAVSALALTLRDVLNSSGNETEMGYKKIKATIYNMVRTAMGDQPPDAPMTDSNLILPH